MNRRLLHRAINLTSAGRIVSSIKGITLFRRQWVVLLKIAAGLVLMKDLWDVFAVMPYPVLVALPLALPGNLYGMGRLGVF